jgi:hypothetical protein
MEQLLERAGSVESLRKSAWRFCSIGIACGLLSLGAARGAGPPSSERWLDWSREQLSKCAGSERWRLGGTRLSLRWDLGGASGRASGCA